MNSIERINHFSFWKPVKFDTSTPGKSYLSHLAWVMGSWADQYASLSSTTVHIRNARHIKTKIDFETEKHTLRSQGLTALKVTSYILSLGVLPILALVIKGIFKKHLNRSLYTPPPVNTVFAERQVGNCRIILEYGSILNAKVDAIVNAANTGLWAGTGVCGAIREEAGAEPFNHCREILRKQNRLAINSGEAVMTTAGDLTQRIKDSIKAIVHAAGPDYRISDEEARGAELLENAYRNSLELVTNPTHKPNFISSEFSVDSNITSIAFPSISTGIFRAPLQEAATIALETVEDFLKQNQDTPLKEVRFVFSTVDPKRPGESYAEALDTLVSNPDKYRMALFDN